MSVGNTTETMGVKAALKMMINPGEVLRMQVKKVSWPFSLIVSGLSFGLLFLQTGMDMYLGDKGGMMKITLLTLMGIGYGTIGIALLAVISWALSGASSRKIPMEWAVSAFALGYSSSLIYGVAGLGFSLGLGWNTAIAFGVTGVLWAIRPMMLTIKQLTGENILFSICLTTCCGVAVLFGWAVFGQIGF